MPQLSTQKPFSPISRFLPHLSVKQMVLRGLGAIVALQAVIVAILWVVSTLRNKSRKKTSFPHLELDPVQVGENTLQIFSYGRELYDAMLAAIDEAQDYIYLETFIWKGDEVGEEFKAHLTRKAEQGVAVYIVFDGFGNLVCTTRL